MTTIQMIPLDKLYPSPANARKTGTKDGIEALAETIHIHGLLNNLVVQPGGEKGTFSVLAGGRRLAALNHLAKAKKLESDYAVPCNVIEIEGDISSEEISLAENEMRQAMHPADQFEAFKRLADEGQGADTIAAKFGVTPRVVEQRLKLAVVSPKLIKVYRDGEMSLEQIMAFSVSTDHKQQEKVWKELPAFAKQQQRDDMIRRAITGKHVPSDNRIARFVGVAAYEAAGGQVLRDLFSDDDEAEAYLANAALLDKLAGEKLAAIADTVKGEGWKWVSITPELPWSEECKFTKRQVRHTQTAEQKAEAAKLRKQIAALEKQHPEDENGDRPEDIDGQLNDLADQAEIAEEGTASWTAKDKELSGVIVTIGSDGKAEIKRGLMKPEDAKAAKKAETTKAKTKSKGAAKDDEPGLSQSLHRELNAHRTAALQAKLVKNPKVALVAVIHALASDTIMDGEGDINPMPHIRPELSSFRNHAEGIDKGKACKEVESAIASIEKKLPDEGRKLWAWLMKHDTKDLLEILAACAAPTVDCVSTHPADQAAADDLATALKLDMTDYWEPTAASYFDRVSKDMILEAVSEACGKAETQALIGMKKGELAKAAERKIKGKGWLPGIPRGGK